MSLITRTTRKTNRNSNTISDDRGAKAIAHRVRRALGTTTDHKKHAVYSTDLAAPEHLNFIRRFRDSSGGGGRRWEWDAGDGLLERGAGGDVLPPGLDVWPLGDEARLGCLAEVEQVGHVVGVGERELVAGEVLVLRKVVLVDVEHLGELVRVLVHHQRVGGAAHHGLDEEVVHQRGGVGVEVVRLHLQPHLQLRRRDGREEVGAVRLVLGRDVPVDRTGLVEDFIPVLQRRDLAERVEGEELGLLVGAGGEVDGDDLEFEALLVEHGGHAHHVGGQRQPVQLQRCHLPNLSSSSDPLLSLVVGQGKSRSSQPHASTL